MCYISYNANYQSERNGSFQTTRRTAAPICFCIMLDTPHMEESPFAPMSDTRVKPFVTMGCCLLHFFSKWTLFPRPTVSLFWGLDQKCGSTSEEKKKVQRKGKDLTFCKAANFMESPNRLRHLIPSTSLNGSSLTHMLSQCNQPNLVLCFCHLACLPKAPLYVSKETTPQPLSKFRPLPGIHVSIHPVWFLPLQMMPFFHLLNTIGQEPTQMQNKSCQYWRIGRKWTHSVLSFISNILREHFNLNAFGVLHNITQFSTDPLLLSSLNQLFLKSPEDNWV